jgi:predicted AlkP superfamily phosphohydrolase/phosphomutase/tetratricopeptide (TPR) repeat protein
MSAPASEKVLLIGWDAADWNVIRPLVDQGRMPHVRRFIEDGVSGNLASLQPMVSPMLWTSVATGKRPHKHGIHGFTEPLPGGDGVRAASSTSRSTKALWNILTQNGLRTHCLNWYASHPPEPINGVCVSNRFAGLPPGPGEPWPPAAEAVHPSELRDILAELRVRPEDLDASMLLPFVPGASRIDQGRDKRLVALAVTLAEAATTHAAATWCLEHRPWHFTAVLYNAIEQFSRLFMAYHPPKQPHVSDEDFDLYHGVIAAAYQFHDMMLGRLLELAGGEATVIIVSDHGYRTGPGRLRDAQRTPEGISPNHRPQGVCLMRGPRVRRGQVLEGAGLLDVTPTVLTLVGLPVGADMDGRAWVEVIEVPAEPDRVMTWDSIRGEAGEHPRDRREPPAESYEVVRHLIELGYVEPPDADARRVVELTVAANRFNLARSLMDAGQPTRAIPLLEELAATEPGRAEYGQALFEAYYSLGRTADCRRIAGAAWARGYRGPRMDLALGVVAMTERRFQSALEHLAEAESANADLPGLQVLVGRAYLRLRHWEAARHAFEKALRLDGDNAGAWHGLATAALGRRDFAAAAECALRAIGLRSEYAEAHYHLGVALSRLGRPHDAAVALRRALSIQPSLLAAHARLIELFKGPLSDPVRARQHRRDAEQVMLRRRLARRQSAPRPGAASGPASGSAGSPPGD